MNEHDTSKGVDAQAAMAAEVAVEAAEEQGLLFTDDVSPLPSDTGYRGPTACNAAGITYRQLDYWAAPAWSSPPCAARRARAPSGSTPSATS